MSDLAAFLLARIAEDEAVAERCVRRNEFGDVTSWHAYRHQIDAATLPSGAVAVPAPGFLAECDAKRRIVEQHDGVHDCSSVDWEANDMGGAGWIGCDVIRLLALPYADHEDYHDKWRP